VGGAVREAGGGGVVKGGFSGKGGGSIKSGGQVFLNFIHNQKVTAKGNVMINEEAIQAQITTEGGLIMTKGKGMLIGGVIRCGKFVEVNELGNEQYVNTVLFVSDAPKQELLSKQVKNEIQTLNDKFAETQKIIAKLLELKYQGGWQSDHEALYRQMEQALVVIPEAIKQGENKLKKIEDEMQAIRNSAYIKVSDKVYTGVKMKIAGCSSKIEHDISGALFKVIDYQVAAIPLI